MDDPPNCSFIVPSVFRKGDLIFAISTSGASPAMAAKLRRKFENSIPENIDRTLEALREARTILNDFKELGSSERGLILKKIVNDDNHLKELSMHMDKESIRDMLKKFL